MTKLNLIEVHVQGPSDVSVVMADRLMRAAQAESYEVRMGRDMEGIKSGDGWFAIDYGSRNREEAEAEINQLIADIEGGAEVLAIGNHGGQAYDWKLQ